MLGSVTKCVEAPYVFFLYVQGFMDYDVDSDEEWEEEEPGESLSHSEVCPFSSDLVSKSKHCLCHWASQEDDASCDEEDEDDGFFVPHGYLSEGEGEGNEEELEVGTVWPGCFHIDSCTC